MTFRMIYKPQRTTKSPNQKDAAKARSGRFSLKAESGLPVAVNVMSTTKGSFRICAKGIRFTAAMVVLEMLRPARRCPWNSSRQALLNGSDIDNLNVWGCASCPGGFWTGGNRSAIFQPDQVGAYHKLYVCDAGQ